MYIKLIWGHETYIWHLYEVLEHEYKLVWCAMKHEYILILYHQPFDCGSLDHFSVYTSYKDRWSEWIWLAWTRTRNLSVFSQQNKNYDVFGCFVYINILPTRQDKNGEWSKCVWTMTKLINC